MAKGASVRYLLLFGFVGIFTFGCARKPIAPSSPAPVSPRPAANVFDDYLKTDFEPTDGFDFAVGDRDGKGAYQDIATGQRYSGWYVATHFTDIYSYGIHTGEDWTGNGPPASDLGQDVHAIANGRVAFADFADVCGATW
jgi:hypothetical protein